MKQMHDSCIVHAARTAQARKRTLLHHTAVVAGLQHFAACHIVRFAGHAVRLLPSPSPTMKNDPEFNIDFVRLVEKHPVLYNYTLTGHSNKPEVEKAWADIGAVLNESGTACQEKWRILRGGFNRYIKKKDENGPGLSHKKPYYLAKYMDFLLPFLKSRSHSGIMKSPNGSHCDTEAPEDAERETIYDHCEVVYEGIDDNNEVINKSDRCEQFIPKKMWETYQYKGKFDNERLWEYQYRNEEPEIKKSRLQGPDNPDLMFMKSLLPDMAQLDERKKMKFKIEVLNSLNRLLFNDTNTVFSQEDKKLTEYA